MIKQNYKSILFATALALVALFVSQVLWIGNASRQEMKNQNASFQTCFNQSISALVNKFMGRDAENVGYSIKPIDEERGIDKMTPEEKANAIDAGNTTNESNVPLMIENALVALSIDSHHFLLTNLDSLIRVSLNDDENIISSNIILQDIRKDSLLNEINNGSASDNKSLFAKTYTAERKIETPAKSYLIKAEYEIKQPGYLQRLGILTIISVIASVIVIGVLFYLIIILRKRYKEIANMKHSFHGAIHDLKSPLAFVYFTLSALEEKETDVNKKTALSLTEDRVIYLTDKILRLLKAGQNWKKIPEDEKQSVFLYDMLEQIEAEVRTMFQEKTIVFENNIASDLYLRGVPDLLEAAMRILIENAVKYNNNSPVVKITGIRDEKCIAIEVTDDGTGISKHQLKHLFKPYHTSDTKHGTGIGLYYAKRIIQAHGGKISAESIFGRGSSFTIMFPENK